MCRQFARLLLVIGACLPIIFCSQPQKPRLCVEARSAPLAGEIVTVKAVADDEATATRAAEAGLAEAQRWDARLDRRRVENQRWMQAPSPLAPVSYDPALTEILELSLGVAAQSGGLFNPLVAPLTERYERGEWIDDAQLSQLMPLLDLSSLMVDKSAHQLQFKREGTGLDLDAIAQGYIADKCLAAMLAAGACSGLTDVGGEVAASGTRPDGTPWRVGIAIGREADGISEAVAITHGAVAVSSDLRNPLFIAGKPYSHILDPRSGRPAGWSGTVAVYAADAATADAWATALFAAGPELGVELARQSGIAARWWNPDGKLVADTGNFPQPVKNSQP
jgi:thiamine biosynthesis lipoprotein